MPAFINTHKTVADFDVGDHVVYRADYADSPKEYGVVTNKATFVVHVRFDFQPERAYGMACLPWQLDFDDRFDDTLTVDAIADLYKRMT